MPEMPKHVSLHALAPCNTFLPYICKRILVLRLPVASQVEVADMEKNIKSLRVALNRKRAGLKKRIASAKKTAKKPQAGKKAVTTVGHFEEPVLLARLDQLVQRIEQLEKFLKLLSQAVATKKRKQALSFTCAAWFAAGIVAELLPLLSCLPSVFAGAS